MRNDEIARIMNNIRTQEQLIKGKTDLFRVSEALAVPLIPLLELVFC